VKVRLYLIVFLVAVAVAAALFPIIEAGPEYSPVFYVPTGEKAVALTFDVLWTRGPVEDLLRVLDQEGVKATFFLTGIWAERHREELGMLLEAGQEIGSHTYSHEDLEKIPLERAEKQIREGITTLEELTGITPSLFRPPFGSYNKAVLKICQALNQKVVVWDVDARDWVELSAEKICSRVLPRVDRGSIVLFHLSSDQSVRALSLIIQELKQQGYEILTVSGLLQKEGRLPQAPFRKEKGDEVKDEGVF